MVPVPVTLVAGSCAIMLNFWLGSRIGKYRHKYQVSVGDGGQEPLLRRMRAQANFIENAPLFLILLGALEIAGANRIGLAILAALFMIARVSHAIGMDGGSAQSGRKYGILLTALVSVALVVWALACVIRSCLLR